MTVLNGAEFLNAALDSILAQSFRDFELIVIDDGSSDDSTAVVSRCSDRRIRLVCQEHRGIASASNRGLELATGEYIARHDADDISLPERFSSQVRFLDAHPEITLLGTGSLLIDADGRPFSRFSPFTRHERLVTELLRGVCPLIHGSIMVRREAILNVGGYKPAFHQAEDVEMFLRMSAQYRLTNLREVLYHLRKHERSFTQQACIDLKIRVFAKAGKFTTSTNADEWARFVEEFDRNFDGSWRERVFAAENLLRRAQMAYARGNSWDAFRCFAAAMGQNPGLAAELPGRIMRRLWRARLPGDVSSGVR
jgi:glycosyltransferase involved in cell wall biosynthesis